MYLSIVLQLLIGVSALIIIFLDYKWYDKREKKFKIARRLLILVTIIITGVSVYTSFDQGKEKNSLSESIKTLQDSISSVNVIAKNLNEQIEPFLKLALEKYPDLPTDDALKNFQLEIKQIWEKTEALELKENNRKEKEVELEKLKNTPPDVKFNVGIKNNKLIIYIKFNNQVPINFRPFLTNGITEYGTNNKYDFFRQVYLAPIIQYPTKEESEFIYGMIENGMELPRDKLLYLRMKIKYSSIYSNEVQSPNLSEKEITLDYLIKPNTYQLVPLQVR